MNRKAIINVILISLFVVSLFVELPLVEAAPALSYGVCEDDSALVGCWQMDEGSGFDVIDGGRIPENNGTIVATDPHRVPGHGIEGQGLEFDGINVRYVIINDNTSLYVSDKITISAWIKPNLALSKSRIIIANSVPNSADFPGYELGLNSDSDSDVNARGKAYLRFNKKGSSDSTYRVNSTSNYSNDANKWIHIAGTYDGSYMRIYYKGSFENSFYAGIPIPTTTSNPKAVHIGIQCDEANRIFSGVIDDVRIYNRTLSDVEIASLTAAPTAVDLLSFTEYARGNLVYIQWSTADEDDLVGFNLYRTSYGDTRVLVNPTLIPAQNPGQMVGANYQFTDEVNLGQHYTYTLELVKTDGNWPGPSVAVRTGFWLHIPILFK